MNLIEKSANNRIQFQDFQEKASRYSQSLSDRAKQHNQTFPFDDFYSRKLPSATSTIASSGFSPYKNSIYSTQDDDDFASQDQDEHCEEFYHTGACMKGLSCELLHEQKEKKSTKNYMRLQMLQNFPQMIGLSKNQRMRSFLE